MINSKRDLGLAEVPSTARYAERLRSADLRVTRPRIAVLHSVHLNPHADTETIIRAVRGCLSDVSRQAVYDILNALTDASVLRRVQPPGSVARYETRVGDNHHHMVCRSCGAIADVDYVFGAAPCLSVSDTKGFQLDEAEVIYWGRCPDCSQSDASDAIPGSRNADPLKEETLHRGYAHALSRNAHIRPMPTPMELVALSTTTAHIPVKTLFKPAAIATGGLATSSTSAVFGHQLPHLQG